MWAADFYATNTKKKISMLWNTGASKSVISRACLENSKVPTNYNPAQAYTFHLPVAIKLNQKAKSH